MRICWLFSKRVCARKTLLFSPHMQFAILLFRQAVMRKAIGLVILTTKGDIFGGVTYSAYSLVGRGYTIYTSQPLVMISYLRMSYIETTQTCTSFFFLSCSIGRSLYGKI